MHWRDGVGEGIGSLSWAHPRPRIRHTPKVHVRSRTHLLDPRHSWGSVGLRTQLASLTSKM